MDPIDPPPVSRVFAATQEQEQVQEQAITCILDMPHSIVAREYAQGLESFESQSFECEHMSTFTVNFFLAGVHHSNDSTEGGQTSSQSGI